MNVMKHWRAGPALRYFWKWTGRAESLDLEFCDQPNGTCESHEWSGRRGPGGAFVGHHGGIISGNIYFVSVHRVM